MLGVYSRIQREGEVVSLAAHRLTDLTGELGSVGDRDNIFPLPHGRVNIWRQAAASSLSERLAFTFTDGDKGLTSREEILLHVALHATIHRGEVCRILWQLSITPPWDTPAVYLHQSEPHRRLQGKPETPSRPTT